MSIKITAENKEEFEEIEAAINKLPILVQSELCKAEKAFDTIKYYFNQSFKNEVKLHVPDGFEYIEKNEEVITIYCRGFGWFEYPYKTEKYKVLQLKK